MNWRELIERPNWMADAECRDVDADLFFPERGASTREAKAVCASCPVRAECLAYAMNTGEKHGIWGGLSERERRRIRRERAMANGHSGRGWLPGERTQPIEHNTNAGYVAHPRRGEDACTDCERAHARYQQDNRPSRARVDWAEVARVANDAEPGRRTDAVAEHFGLTRQAASHRIKNARYEGYDITDDRAQRSAS